MSLRDARPGRPDVGLADDVQLVSINDHLMEPPDLWTAGRPGRLEDVPHVVELDGAQMWLIGDLAIPVAQTGVLGADPGGPRATRYAEMHPGATDPAQRLESMDLDGVEVQTIWPNVIGFAGERLRHLGDARRWEQAARRYNDVLHDWCAEDPDRLAAAAVLPLHDGARALAEAERAAGLGARAVTFPHAPGDLGLATFYGGEWDPLLSFMEEAGLPLVVHIGPGVGAPAGARFDSLGALLTTASFHVAASLVDAVFARVPTRHPRLDVVYVEGATGWLPFVDERMDFFVRRPEVWDVAASGRLPSEVSRRLHASFIDDPYGVSRRREIGLSRMVWQCDFPHNDSFWPDSRSHLATLLADVPADEVRLLAEDNARRLLRLPRRAGASPALGTARERAIRR